MFDAGMQDDAESGSGVRLRRGTSYVGLVAVAQIAAFVGGILVVRTLSKNDYAAYAAAVAAISAAVAVADSGIGSALMARMASADGPSERFALMRGALAVRQRVSIPVLIAVAAGLVVVFAGLRLAVPVAAVCVLIVAVIVSNALLRSLYVVDLQIKREFVPIVRADAVAGVLRVLITLLAVWIAMVNGAAVVEFLLIFLVASLLQTAQLRRSSGFHASSVPLAPASSAPFRQAFVGTAPWTVLMIAGEQLINLLLTFYGNAAGIAEIAALTRYSLAFGLVNSLVGNVLTARVAHIDAEPGALRSALRRVVSGGLVLVIVYVAGLWLLRAPLLALLGDRYAHLDQMFLLLSVASATQFFAVYVLGVFTHARGWLRGSWTFGPLLAAWLVCTIWFIQPRDSGGAAWTFFALQLPTLAMQIVRIALGLRARTGVAEG